MTLTLEQEKDFKYLREQITLESPTPETDKEALTRIRRALEEAQAHEKQALETVAQLGQTIKRLSRPDTEADGVVLCGKCGARRSGDY